MLALVGLLGSCGLVTSMWGKPDHFVPRDRRPRSATDLLDLRGVVHCHSFHSHDSTGTIEEIGAACESIGMDFLIMTDHPSPYSVSRGQRGMVGDTLFLTGAEIRVPGGTLLAFPLKHYVRPHKTLQAILDDIHGQGGLAFVGHAERYTRWEHLGIDGVEVHNLHAAAKAGSVPWMVLKTLFMPLRVLFWSLAVPDRRVFANWDGFNARKMVPAVGGNDAHSNIRLLGPLGWVLGNYDEIFSVMSTHVLAERLDQESLVEGIRRGRTYIVMDIWSGGSGFAFWAVDRGVAHEMGATVARDATLHVRSPQDAEIRLLRGGDFAARGTGRTFEFKPKAAGVYRVEVWLDGEPWIFSSPIRVK